MSRHQHPISTQLASDLVRDGMGLELLDHDGNVIAEVFRYDNPKRVVVSTFVEDIPASTLARFVERARARLDPFEDGTPLRTIWERPESTHQ